MPDTQISEEMVERGAQALCEAMHGNKPFVTEYYKPLAKAALEAALSGHVVVPREPTEAMLRRGSAMKIDTAMAPGHPELKENGGKYSAFELMSLETWRAMIQAALPVPEMEG